jgi:hypothetical protein
MNDIKKFLIKSINNLEFDFKELREKHGLLLLKSYDKDLYCYKCGQYSVFVNLLAMIIEYELK